ncbi:MAG: peptidoglycan editing factor PgeF [Armatimonadetes bacterium]|nr:peptidoglycan editing factor PgeF [Armatimonadota bacterium]
MSGWKRQAVGDLPMYQATAMAWLPGIVQGFTTRSGGVSAAPYDTLNFGADVGDSAAAVQANRERLWSDLGFAPAQVALAEQVHGNGVARVTQGGPTPAAGADALITDTPNVLLMLLYADCVPVYLADPVGRSLGLMHVGWRGATAGIVAKTVAAMRAAFGMLPGHCMVAIGPSIAADNYEVGRDVADQFRNFPGGSSSGASTAVLPRDEMSGKYTLNLRQIVFTQLLAAGLKAEYISVCDEDTYRNRRDFFSHRRDGAATGRMAAFLSLRSSTEAV